MTGDVLPRLAEVVGHRLLSRLHAVSFDDDYSQFAAGGAFEERAFFHVDSNRRFEFLQDDSTNPAGVARRPRRIGSDANDDVIARPLNDLELSRAADFSD